MQIRILVTVFLLASSLPVDVAASSDASLLSATIEAALENDAQTSFRLDVDCTDSNSSRSLKLFRGTVAVWNRERQVLISEEDKVQLLKMLLDDGFPSFDARYGGRPKSDKEEAALRVSCRIYLRLQDLEKTSVQLADGEQSDAMLGLAARLLDQVEKHAADGITVSSLKDGLTKLANGPLVPEVLNLRLLWLPADGDGDDRTGYIFRVEGGDVSRQSYLPGEAIGTEDERRLTNCEANKLIDILNKTRIWDLPANLRHDGLTELDVSVLGHRKSVIARASFKPSGDDARTAFVALIKGLVSPPCQ